MTSRRFIPHRLTPNALAGFVMVALLCAAPRQASAHLFNVLDAADGTVYAIFSNSLYDQSVITQLVATSSAAIGLTSATGGMLSSFEWTTGSLFSVIGQSAIIPSASVAGFNPTGSGLLTFGDGSTIGVGDLGLFSGIATTQSPNPPGYVGTLNVYGFNLTPGGHPTTTLASFGPPPLDGIGIGTGQSIVFGFSPPPGVGRAIGFGSFSFNSSRAVLASAGSVAFPGPRIPPVIPEPSSLTLLGAGLLGVLRFRAVGRRRS